MDNSNFECNICFHQKLKEEEFPLPCCKNNFICKCCSEQLRKAECPFCRIYLKSISKSIKKTVNEISFLDHHIEDFDEFNYYSKIYRRKRKQFLKLQNRQQNYLKNLDAITKKKPDYKKYFQREIRNELKELRIL